MAHRLQPPRRMRTVVWLALLVACNSAYPARTGATDLEGGPIDEVWAASSSVSNRFSVDKLGWVVWFGSVTPNTDCGEIESFADAALWIDTDQVETPALPDVVLSPGDVPIIPLSEMPAGTQAAFEPYSAPGMQVNTGTLTITSFSFDGGLVGSLTANGLDNGLPIQMTGTFVAPTCD